MADGVETLEAPAEILASLESVGTDGGSMSAEEAVAAAVEWCRDAQVPPSHILIPPALDRLSDEAIRYFAIKGWIDDTNTALHRQRSSVPDDDADNGAGSVPTPRHGRNDRMWRKLDMRLVGADESLKPLLEFTDEDLDKLVAVCESHRAAFARRKKWGKAAREALSEYEADRVADLPADVLEELDDLAAESWT